MWWYLPAHRQYWEMWLPSREPDILLSPDMLLVTEGGVVEIFFRSCLHDRHKDNDPHLMRAIYKDKDKDKDNTNTNNTKTKTIQRQTIQRQRQSPTQRQTLRQWSPPYVPRISGRRPWGRRGRRGESQAPSSPHLMTIIGFFRVMVDGEYKDWMGRENKLTSSGFFSLLGILGKAAGRVGNSQQGPNLWDLLCVVHAGDSIWQWWYLLWCKTPCTSRDLNPSPWLMEIIINQWVFILTR